MTAEAILDWMTSGESVRSTRDLGLGADLDILVVGSRRDMIRFAGAANIVAISYTIPCIRGMVWGKVHRLVCGMGKVGPK